MEPLISIIVPVYNVEAYLGRCVESLRRQTYERLEIILVDDGSLDGCPGLCDAYAREDGRIRVIHQANAGLSGARNAGIEAAKGDYFAFVDSDDYVAEDFIRVLYELVRETGCAMSQCCYAYVQGEALRPREDQERDVRIYRDQDLMWQLYGPEEEATCFVVAWNKLYRRDLFRGIRYPPGRIHEDEATTYRLFHEGKALAVTKCALYGYFTENTGSITASFSGKRLQWLTAHEERIRFFLENGYESLMPAACRKLCDACITFYGRAGQMDGGEGRGIQRELKERLRHELHERAGWIRRLPWRTRAGYRLFLMSPALYAGLLKRMG